MPVEEGWVARVLGNRQSLRHMHEHPIHYYGSLRSSGVPLDTLTSRPEAARIEGVWARFGLRLS